MLHPCGEIWLRGLQQSMNVIWHPTKRQNDPTTALDFLAKPLGKAFVVAKIMKQGSASIATGDDVIVCTGELDSRWSRHEFDHR
jgi:hypothetical protein